MNSSYEFLWVRYFAFTVIIEMLVAFPMLRSADVSVPRRIGAILVANFTTHPLVFFFWAKILHDRTVLTLVAESWALLAETGVYALIFSDLKWPRALAVSALANGASYSIGVIANRMHWLT
ncbi:MAG: hypothetical protein ABI183_18150 [Polyangiaceae bacterium]